MIRNRSRSAALLLATALGAASARADLPLEQATVAPLAPATAQRLYLSDMVISHFVDGKLMIIDGETFKVQGHVALGMTGHATLSPDRSEILVSTAYMTKLNRGERIGELDIYDAATLKLKAEISVPNKHAQSMPYRGSVRTTSDGRFVMLQNATPAQSVTVVDRKAEKFVTEIQTPGCWMIYPAQSVPNRFATLCGDGTMLTITLDDNGMPAQRKKSRKFFDADADALFVAGDQDGDNYTFVSFNGKVQTVNVAGEEAAPAETWSLVRLPTAEPATGQRPPVRGHAPQGQGRQPQGTRQGDLGVRPGQQAARGPPARRKSHRDHHHPRCVAQALRADHRDGRDHRLRRRPQAQEAAPEHAVQRVRHAAGRAVRSAAA
jgi:methylamine dehydrogenase heavy chain